ncbi:hypothetical protein CPB84DRAFT_1751426 [Gymnopilus junonius]|uniref:Uncharacterized protein n=1 Tax=Gymnopilus junonius TaxID=109634 RepID=A0A9P5ND01_GYMJU|nr:hypothetical protein CPB84DRAFT_1751426 [Gymnopilus junonius]
MKLLAMMDNLVIYRNHNTKECLLDKNVKIDEYIGTSYVAVSVGDEILRRTESLVPADVQIRMKTSCTSRSRPISNADESDAMSRNRKAWARILMTYANPFLLLYMVQFIAEVRSLKENFSLLIIAETFCDDPRPDLAPESRLTPRRQRPVLAHEIVTSAKCSSTSVSISMLLHLYGMQRNP